MTFGIRRATSEDVERVREFASDTFDWGDYVADALPEWLDDPSGAVWVAVDDNDSAIGVARAVMLSSREAWLHAARVEPAHRRSGVGSALNEACRSWAATEGAVVVRLLIEDWNTAARAQVASIGFRPEAAWMWATIEIGSEVIPSRNGGRRVPSEERLSPGRTAETDVAWMSWANGEIARSGRELIPFGWAFRRVRPADLESAARERALWQSPSGWLIAKTDDDGTLTIPWLSTTDIDVARLFRAVFDLAEGLRAERVRVFAPRVDWLLDELERVGYAVQPSTVFVREP